jgi:uncharacterized membrane protein HdeD (DUF308 family)
MDKLPEERRPETADKYVGLPFLSYAREDSDFALRLVKDLRTAGAIVWLDQIDIRPGERWDQSVENALARCSSLVVVLSPASVASANVMDEVSFALEGGKVVVPVLYRDCTIPFRLRRLQYLDFRINYENGLRDLLQTITLGNSQRSTQFPAKDASPAVSAVHAWRPLLWRAAAALALAFLTFFRPSTPYSSDNSALAIFLGSYCIADGIILVRSRQTSNGSSSQWLFISEACLDLLTGLILIFRASNSSVAVGWLTFWAIGRTLLTFRMSTVLRRDIPDEKLMLSAAAVSLLFGMALLLGSASAFWSREWMVSLYALALGVLLLMLALRLRAYNQK